MVTMSKAFQIFDSNIRGMKQHLQLMDASLVNADKICRIAASKKSANTIGDALKSIEIYPQLNTPCRTRDISRTFITARVKVHEQAIVDLYRYFMYYLLNLIKEFMTIAPIRLLKGVAASSENQIPYLDILSHNKSELIEIMSKAVLKRFENERSTQKILKKLLTFSGINLNEKVKQEALLCLNIRHLIIHNNSKADETFIKMNNGFVQINRRNKLLINYELSSKAIKIVYTLCSEIDNKLIEKQLLNPIKAANTQEEII